MAVARASFLAEDLLGWERLAALAVPAMKEALTPLLGACAGAHRLGVAVGLPPARPGWHPTLGGRLVGALREALRVLGWSVEIDVVSVGHAGGVMALERAIHGLDAGIWDVCLVGGADSYLQPKTLEWLDYHEQFHGAGNAWGFVPGEAAGFCLIARADYARRHGLSPLGEVLATAYAQETHLRTGPGVCVGRGLTTALQAVLGALPDASARVDRTLCDMNGEPYRADEYGFTLIRTSERFVDAADFIAPADCWGDVGAASGPLFILLALAAAQRGYATGLHSLIWTSSEGGERAAALLRV